MKRLGLLSRLRHDRRGVAAIEFAMVAPLLILLMSGLLIYGSWFWMAHSVQSLASEGARAAIAGLDRAEREQLAVDFVTAQVGDLGLRPEQASVSVDAAGSTIRVTVAYDAADHPLMALSGLVPSPPRIIRRTAVVRLGGY
ncbi:TadE/TadG family type IV pilus assembly protein [Brevundimonas pondensis]|jgi:Flp pilus assembly protein TadG|uniref:TadE/TadG family type IV pilus assembly protein n=1 Tax=Brevundimonas pondensis TaxID=2774189 RepID=UPI0028D691AF|nr:TadE/TadG family type IV pilus assembly protein [uncultured Brevundimonas sp.]